MRVSRQNKELADKFCQQQECDLLGFKSNGFLYRKESGGTKRISFVAAAALLGITKDEYDKRIQIGSLSNKIMRAVMEDLRSYEKYEANTQIDGQITFEIPAYKCTCAIVDDHYVRFQARYVNPIDGTTHMSIDRMVKYQ